MVEQRKLILVTNDDGVKAKGLQVLSEVASHYGDVVVVAPNEGQSGMSHAITIKIPIRVEEVHRQENMKIYGCSGTPVDSVKIALNKILHRKPDIVLSGINHGSNASTSVIYSGTMAAAIEGCINQIPSIGFSILDYAEDAEFEHVLQYIHHIISKVLFNGIPEGICLNVNMPQLNGQDIKGIKVCRQNNGYWREEFDHRVDPQNKHYYWLTGEFYNLEPDADDTDEWALKNNYVSVVPVKIDFTCLNTIDKLKSWETVKTDEK